jgi:hypothetical protein
LWNDVLLHDGDDLHPRGRRHAPERRDITRGSSREREP